MTKAITIEKSEMEVIFRYNPVTYILERIFRGKKWRVVKLKPGISGYSRVSFNGRYILVHRLIYTLFHGNIDEDIHIDHWDGNPENNKISNLQPLSNRDNIAKSRAGVNPYFDEYLRKYRVQPSAWVEGKVRSVHLGYFKDEAEAEKMCDAYNETFGWNKPLYKARLGTYEEWLEYMEAFKNQYIKQLKARI